MPFKIINNVPKGGKSNALLFAVPTVGAELALGKSDRLDDTIYGLEIKRVEFQLLANGLSQVFAAGRGTVGVFL